MDINNFKNIGFKIIVHNLTSRTDSMDFNFNAIEEFLEGGCILKLPPNSCQASHSLMLGIFNDNTKITYKKFPVNGNIPEAFMVVTGKITQLNTQDKEYAFYPTVIFSQYDTDKWNQILSKFKNRQDDITKLVTKIKE
ncbi:MAG: hypothetical protein U0T83_03920 [Bacteriovoracaceae bacterium]